MAEIKCPKCAGPVQFDAGTKFTKCSYCSSQIYIDRSGAGFYYAIPFKLSESDAVGTFKRWAGGSTKAKGLDRLAQVTKVGKDYFPVYMFRRDIDGREEVLLEPASSTILPGLHQLKLPGGDLQIFDAEFNTSGADVAKPDIAMTHYLTALPGKAKEQSLVYFPIWKIEYKFKGQNYLVVVDASSSEVFASSFPTRSSMAYLAVSILGFMAFVAEGLLATVNLILGAALMAVTVAAVFAASLFVARRL
jgi:hypothetical protein